MKNESEMARHLKAAAEATHREWVVLKHCDRFTKGIPDFSFSLGERTVWVEQKHVRSRRELFQPMSWAWASPVQLHLAAKLNGFYQVHCQVSNETVLIPATLVQVHFNQGIFDIVKALPGDGTVETIELILRRLTK